MGTKKGDQKHNTVNTLFKKVLFNTLFNPRPPEPFTSADIFDMDPVWCLAYFGTNG